MESSAEAEGAPRSISAAVVVDKSNFMMLFVALVELLLFCCYCCCFVVFAFAFEFYEQMSSFAFEIFFPHRTQTQTQLGTR